MNLFMGSAALSGTLLFYAWVYAAHRRPLPSGWTRHDVLSQTAVLVLVGLLPLAFGFLIAAALNPVATLRDMTVFTALGALAGPVLCWLLFGRLMAPARVARPANLNPEPGNGGTPADTRLAA